LEDVIHFAKGVVWKGKLRGLQVAVKKLYESKLDDSTLDSFRKEVAIMRYVIYMN
jgi:uncharacterized membrane protein